MRDVAGHEIDGRNRRLHAHRHGAQMHGHVVAHGNHARLAIEDGAGVVAALLDIGRERGAAQGSAHLLGNGMHGALKDRQLNRIGCPRHHARSSPARVMTRFPNVSTRADAPGGSTVAAVYSVIIAGPRITSPGRKPSRR